MTNWKHEKEQKSKIKIIRTGVEISLTKRIIIIFLEEGEREKKKNLTAEKPLYQRRHVPPQQEKNKITN
jgi:hypothetical protein